VSGWRTVRLTPDFCLCIIPKKIFSGFPANTADVRSTYGHTGSHRSQRRVGPGGQHRQQVSVQGSAASRGREQTDIGRSLHYTGDFQDRRLVFKRVDLSVHQETNATPSGLSQTEVVPDNHSSAKQLNRKAVLLEDPISLLETSELTPSKTLMSQLMLQDMAVGRF
jgi:hypothetical protein